MHRVVVWLAALLILASCDRSSIRHFLHRLRTKSRTPMDAVTPLMKDQDRHQQFLEQAKEGGIDVLFLGDSITDWWPKLGEESWRRLVDYKPANFGVSGDRTEHLLWRITHGELEGINPKVVVILIGTNNIGNFEDERPEWIASGIKQIVATVHERLPAARVLLLGIFPRDGKESAGRKIAREVNEVVRGLDDGDKTRFLDIGESFLDRDGNILPDVIPDQLHLVAKGYEIWLEKMTPLLSEMMRGKIDKQ
jgi:lysophospholipase L1-like esterase